MFARGSARRLAQTDRKTLHQHGLGKSGNGSVPALSNVVLDICQAFCDIRFCVDLEIRPRCTERPEAVSCLKRALGPVLAPAQRCRGRRPESSGRFILVVADRKVTLLKEQHLMCRYPKQFTDSLLPFFLLTLGKKTYLICLYESQFL